MKLSARTFVTALGAGALALGLAACEGEVPGDDGTAATGAQETATEVDTTAGSDGETTGTAEAGDDSQTAGTAETGDDGEAGGRGTHSEDEVLQAVSDGLDEDSLAATLAASETVMVTDRTPEWMTDLEFYQLDGILGSPRGAVVAISSSDEVLEIDSRPENLATISAEHPVADAAAAEQRAADFLELSRSMFTWSYQVDSVQDVEWRDSVSGEEQDVADQFVADYGDVIAPPTAEADGEGWSVTVYRMEQDTALQYTVTVNADGSITEENEVIAEGLPGPIGL